jgi:cytidylate kinase
MMNTTAPIRIITISREFGAGGRFVGERLARALGWKLWDKELAHEVARVAGVPEQELAAVDERAGRSTLWDRLRGRPSHRAYLAALKEWMDQIAEEGNAVVIGRGAAILLRYRAGALHVRLVAPLSERAGRARELDPALVEAASLARCRQTDADRSRYVQYFFGEDVAEPLGYHATVNTGQLVPETAADILAALAAPRAEPTVPAAGGPTPSKRGPRILTLTSQLGSRETDLAREVARRLKLTVWDREALAREAGLPGAGEADLAECDPAQLEALGRVMAELGKRGDVLVVGWGGLEFLKGFPSALRVKLVAPTGERVRRVVEYRWVDAGAAQATVADSDTRRGAFYEKYFRIDWHDPLNYDLVLNTAALGPRTAELVVQAASLRWYARNTEGSVTGGSQPPKGP